MCKMVNAFAMQRHIIHIGVSGTLKVIYPHFYKHLRRGHVKILKRHSHSQPDQYYDYDMSKDIQNHSFSLCSGTHNGVWCEVKC